MKPPRPRGSARDPIERLMLAADEALARLPGPHPNDVVEEEAIG